MSPPEQPTTDEPTDTPGGYDAVSAKAAPSATATEPKHVDYELFSSQGGPLTTTTTTTKATTTKAERRLEESRTEGSIVSSQIAAQPAAETTRSGWTAASEKNQDIPKAMTPPSAAVLSQGLPHPLASAPTHYLAAEPSGYIDPTPATPVTSQPPSRSPSNTRRSRAHSPPRSDDGDKSFVSDDEPDGGSRSEIQSIMEQFSEAGGGPGEDEVMSPRLEIASPRMGGSVQLPPRRSSLEPATPSLSSQLQELNSNSLRPSTASPASVRSRDRLVDDQAPPVPPKDAVFAPPARPKYDRAPSSMTSPLSPALPVHLPPPPEPEPEPALPFDFHRFLEQLRNKKADPVARYLKSFLFEFGRKQWMVHEQVKIIGDFLAFIANKMAQCEVWRDVSDAEFDNAREGMEKLVMNRLYTQTFSPAIAPPKPIPGAKPKRRGDDVPMGPGRRGQHQEDVERDDVLTQKINIYGWIKEEHLDIAPLGDTGCRFLKLAQQELLKIKSYRAPRDKIICVLNCSKVIFGLLKHNRSDASADSFMPLLIYVVLQSNPEHLVSNVQYILRFRNQEKLAGEAGYYLSSLMGAVQFVESMDRSSLTISDDDFERNVEAAVSVIAENHSLISPVISQQAAFGSEKQPPRAPDDRPSVDADLSTPRPRPRSSASNDSESRDEAPAIAGLLRSIQKPLSSIGRIFTDEAGPSSPALSPAPAHLSSRASGDDAAASPTGARPVSSSKHGLSAEEAAARQASAETAEALRLQRAEHANVVETLAGMFPDLDRDLISDVVYQKQGRVGLAVDACLALST